MSPPAVFDKLGVSPTPAHGLTDIMENTLAGDGPHAVGENIIIVMIIMIMMIIIIIIIIKILMMMMMVIIVVIPAAGVVVVVTIIIIIITIVIIIMIIIMIIIIIIMIMIASEPKFVVEKRIFVEVKIENRGKIFFCGNKAYFFCL